MLIQQKQLYPDSHLWCNKMGQSGSVVRQHVEQARKTGVCSLRELKLTQFPAEPLLSLKATLRTLDLSHNQLGDLPPAIGEFKNLRTLNLSHNHLAELPEGIGDLRKLETLNLEGNSLQSLPDSIVNIKTLKTVNLSRNKLKTFPPFLYQLAHLDFADLSRNQVSSIPPGIENLHVVELNLNQNQISVLPAEIASCKRLKVLRVQENTLSLMGIPTPLLAESAVSLLCVEGNVFDMRELKELPEYDMYMERYSATKRKAD